MKMPTDIFQRDVADRACRSGRRMKRFERHRQAQQRRHRLAPFLLTQLQPIEKPRLGMNGNGCAGSIDSGVSTGKIACSKSISPASCFSSLAQRIGVTIRMSSLARYCCSTASEACCSICRLSTSAGAVRAVRPGCGRPGCFSNDALAHLAFEAGDAHHEELVEIGGRDRQEADALQQRMIEVQRFLENAPVELQPGKFAVDEPLGTGSATLRAAERWPWLQG
jgi:hypothetical protein